MSTSSIHKKVIVRKTEGRMCGQVMSPKWWVKNIQKPLKDLLSSQLQRQNIDMTKPLTYKSHYSYTAAKNSMQICICIWLILQNLKIKEIFLKKKKKITQELDIFFPPQNSSFQGKLLDIKFPKLSSISLVFTINWEQIENM